VARPRFKHLAISDRRSLPSAGQVSDWLRALAGAGVEAVQLREKDLADRDLFELAERARLLLPPPIALLINGRIDIAVAAGADGVHLPSNGVPTASVRRWRERRPDGASPFLIGRSVHSREEAEAARRDGADYVTFGPVFPSPGKGEGVGLAALAEAVETGIPVYALGGVKIEELGAIAAAGAAGVAAIRLFQNLSGLPSTLAAARRFFGRAGEGAET
jgi:thiamine-phosphate pyrophosphorylase